ncbi:DNA internalization-related competence protein ComEC/Rec2 [Pseudoflavonifractor phocaeensis]|uniref:DNA internalization-related competence protein ComEC/Rec2 n=1 Tax=Pseudoflavonifractor phocaeensis TaxID=1870988 RepID=UPI001F21B59C|nr:DNA internalization-related competence protein ComEC/Rec2 [Pseudoflavonifractor phocaeensis]MCF2661107.1 DNA internalization-related competence protein ComEC/Rec2 [Pseudoflavonifractor phocaeensis]
MRILAIFASAFSAAVFLANYVLPENCWLPVGGGLALLGLALWLLLRSRTRPRKVCALLCAGAAVGLIWTAIYTAIFFQPARELDGRTVRLSATVADWPQETDYGWSVLVRADTDTFVRLSAILYVDEQGADLRPGDRLSTVAHCTLGDRTFAGEEITYYTAKGIFLRAQTYGRLDIQRPGRVPVWDWPAVLSRDLKRSIAGVFPEDVSPLIRGLVTGNRDSLTDAFTSSLQRVGLSHTVSVSGMHLAFLAALVAALMGRGKRSTALVTILFVLAFCGVAGSTPSVTRAAVMILLLQIAPLLGRERDGPTALAFALMLLLAWNPFSAAHVGLQLSFGAVAGILLVSDTIQVWMLRKLRLDKRPKNRLLRLAVQVPRFLVSVLCATLGASVLTVPLVAIHFQTFSLISPISNLLTLWAVALLFLSGLFLGLLGMFHPGPAAVLAIPFTAIARWLIRVVEALGRLPMAAIPLESFYYRAWIIFLCLLLAVTLLSKGGRRPVIPLCAGAVTLAVSLLFTSLTFQAGKLTAAVLDVGQGQSVLLQAGNYLTLVDCGGDSPDNAGDVAADYLHSLGRNTLDLLVVSHYHTDHANGIPQLLKRIDVSAIALPDVEEGDPLRREILELAEDRGVEVWLIQEDTRVSLGGEQEFMLYAPLGRAGETNELGLTVLATAGDYDVLIPGDMDGQTEQLLLDHVRLPDIELLVAGHHGSKYSTTEELLEAVRPEVAVISVGKSNSYGHPAPDTLERLDRAGAELYRTDLQGTVVIRFRPEK